MRLGHLAPAVRQRLVRLPDPYGSHQGVVPAAPPADTPDLSGQLDRLLAASVALARVATLRSESGETVLTGRMARRRDAVASCSIEGIRCTLEEALLAEIAEEGVRPQAIQARDCALILDRLVPEAAARGPSMFGLPLILRMHALAMRGDRDFADIPGTLRSNVVWIGGGGDIAYSTWNPPPPAMVETCLFDTVCHLRGNGTPSPGRNPIVRMAVSHAHFEAVHPFSDGNGRVGRLLLPLAMAADGHPPLYLSAYVEAHRGAYHAALGDAQQRLDWTPLIGLLADAAVASVDDLMATRAALADIRESWKGRRRFREGAASTRALDLLPDRPVVTAGGLSELLGVTFAQANQAAGQLVDAGIISEATGRARGRVFVAREVLGIWERPFGMEPVLPGSDDPEPESDPFAP